MKVATLTLNPCLDHTMYFDVPFLAGELNRATHSVLTLGSKGINVSRLFKQLGIEATAYGFCGGQNGVTMKAMLDTEAIAYQFVSTRAETRMNTKMIDFNGICTEANEKGGPIWEDEYHQLLDLMENKTNFPSYFLLGGSIPQGVEKTVYADFIASGKQKGAKMILDCDGEALRYGIEAQPYMIKPNLFELSQYVGITLSSKEEIIAACEKIYVEKGCSVLCTLGGNGAIYVGEQGFYTVTSPKVTLRGFTGAGDTFLASFLYAMEQGDAAYALRFASSAAAAKVELAGTELPDKTAMQKYLDVVQTYKLK